MKGIVVLYPISALFVVFYWGLWITEIGFTIFGSDGSIYLSAGIISLYFMAALILLWLAPRVRESAYKTLGKWQSLFYLATTSSFFVWGVSLLVSAVGAI